ncbi:MAG: DUF2516 family protein [Cellulomonadaceae bacterium]|nr:DUF2516 family protein [Cellulomonadaceae bacterium]
MFYWIRFILMAAVAFATFLICVIGCVDAWHRPEKAYVTEGKQTKKLWLFLLGLGTLVGAINVLGFLSGMLPSIMFALLPAFPGAIYWFGVKPAIEPYGTGK